MIKMTKRSIFETDLQALAKANVKSAAEGEQNPTALLRDALARLEADPAIFGGDPEGVFTYEDPILAVAALWHKKGTEAAPSIGTAGEGISNSSVFDWMLTGINACLNRPKVDYVALAGRTPSRIVKIEKPNTRIAIVGDAGYSSPSQTRILRQIKDRHQENNFDLVIHLGDTYPGGSEAEMLSNLLAPLSTIRLGNVFTLCGNHDLYYGAKGYLAALKVLQQPGRYFAIETPNWRIACLDTALGAESFLRDDGILDEGQLDWLSQYLATDDGRRLILMSHHYILSAWGKPSPSLTNQLAERLRESGRVFSWYWGHEHGCATYGRQPHGFYGACVGNGAFMEKYKPPSLPDLPEWYATNSCTCEDSAGSSFWPHGYLELELMEKEALEIYHLENGQSYRRSLSAPA